MILAPAQKNHINRLPVLPLLLFLTPIFAQSVMTNPSGTQTVTQPAGTTLIVNSLNQTLDASAYSSIQAAINSLPSSGGVITIPCGTFIGPTSLPSNVHLISRCGGMPIADLQALGGFPNYPTINLTTLTESSGLTLTNVSNVEISGIVLDFRSASGNLILTGVGNSEFDMAVLCNASSPCVNLLAGTASGTNTALNSFSHLITAGGSWGVEFSSGSSSSFSTENHFGFVNIIYPATGGILFDKWCDSNVLDDVRMFFSGSSTINIPAIEFGSSTADDQGAFAEKIKYVDVTSTTNSSPAFIVNYSNGNEITSGIMAGYTTVLQNTFDSTIYWLDTLHGSITNSSITSHNGMFANPNIGPTGNTLGINEFATGQGDGITHFGYNTGSGPPFANYIAGAFTYFYGPISIGGGANISNSSSIPQIGTTTAGQAACIKSSGPPIVLGYCSSFITSSGSCTCN